jgi:SRSO17 transposase
MELTARPPQVPSEPLPELAEFLEPFRVRFRQNNSFGVFERYITGLLIEHPNKNCETMAEVVPGANAQQLNHVVSDLTWDEAALNGQRIQIMLGLESEGDGALIFDDTGFAKQGSSSAGVQRQYSGTLGKVANCQITVNCHLAERTLAWPVATRLYLPESWASDAERRAKAHIPEQVVFLTKPEIALDLLDEAREAGVRWRCVVADADYGDNPVFLNGLEERKEVCCVAVRCDFRVSVSRKEATARADDVLLGVPRKDWRTIQWSEGSRGVLRAKFVRVRCYRVDGDGTRHLGWLIGQRPSRGEGEWKYFWASFSAKTPLETMVEYTHRRHWVEQFHEEAKGLLGWDQFQGRRWDGFHRNAVTVMLAFSFLVWLEWRERPKRAGRGRPRSALSPSEGSQASIVGLGPSGNRRLAQRPSLHRVGRVWSHRSLPLNAGLTE